MSTHPFTPITVCSVCGLSDAAGDHVVKPAPSTGAGRVRSFWVHWNSVVKNDAAGRQIVQREALRRSFFLVNQGDAWMVPVAKLMNPALKILVYKDASSTRPGVPFPGPTGVPFDQAPDAWFAHTASGQRIEYQGYPGHWLMDVGNRDYQADWTRHVLDAVTAGGFDGVFIDNLLWTRDAYGQSPSGYSSDLAWQQAYRSFLATVRPDFQANGKVMFGNLSNARLAFGRWSSYLGFLDGAWDEWWLTFGDAKADRMPEYPEGWSRIVNEIALCEAAGKTALVQPHCSSGLSGHDSHLYALASYLIGNGARSAFAPVSQVDGYGFPSMWDHLYDVDLGDPVGKIIVQANGVRYRQFTRGLAAVNAGDQNVSLDLIQRYTNADTQAYESQVFMAPRTGGVWTR